jgi:serine/threonine protein kinase
VDSALSVENHTYLAIGPGGRGIVLKKLDSDCLWNGSLHPNVKERLSRVRELAHPGVANLFGVSRDGDDAYLMWEYIEGTPVDQYAAAPERTARELAVVARELILTVDLLHMQGLVHGALVPGNVIVMPHGGIRLAHLSPLLYTDPAVDAESVLSLIEQMIDMRGSRQDAPLAQLLAEARQQGLNLRAVGAKLANLISSQSFDLERPGAEPVIGIRRRALYGAALAAALGIGTACGIWYGLQPGHFFAMGNNSTHTSELGR